MKDKPTCMPWPEVEEICEWFPKELRSCPHCGGRAKLEQTVCDLSVRCECCPASMRTTNSCNKDNRWLLISKWNLRKPIEGERWIS